jgi:hypothetical protein
MKKINLSFLVVLMLSACTRSPEKPKLTISEYTQQAVIIKGVLEKILAETDYKKMHEIAQAVESSRAVNCIAISEECNVYGEVLNKIVEGTQKGLPGEAENVAIYKKIGDLDRSITEGHEKLAEDWKLYINAKSKAEEGK